MAKLYPPNISGTIPAFYYVKGAANDIVVPFTMNRAVSPDDIAGFVLQIKSMNNKFNEVVSATMRSANISAAGKSSVRFHVSEQIKFTVGQFYKVQLAYKDKDGVIGYYSTVGIIKCTTKPKISIDHLVTGQTNIHMSSYTGVYSQSDGDITEKMYSSYFVIFDSNYNIIFQSPEKIHNTSYDNTSYEAHEELLYNKDLKENNYYYIEFVVTTVNQLVEKSPAYKIMQRNLINPEISADLVAIMNYDNGYIQLSLNDEIDSTISGNFVLSRASSNNDYAWEELKRFEFNSMPPKDWGYMDYTVEQGITYKYALQQYNLNDVYSERIVSNTIMADFEDMFLFDGNRQLKIRFNPQVSSFKSTILESKTDTIGSQFPFFSRNGNVNYKEFPIAGLISYLMDDAETFIKMSDIGLDGFVPKQKFDVYGKYKTTNLVGYNIAAERTFKHEVLNWLNNGQVKLFKSPAEGNFLVRLMNVSLSPIDSLNRMLHSFSATAYEVEKFNLNALSYYKIINVDYTPTVLARWMTVDIKTAVKDYLESFEPIKTLEQAIGETITLNTKDTDAFDFADMTPGAQISIAGQNILIGATGSYHVEVPKNDIYSAGTIKYEITANNEGQLTYRYYTQNPSVFGNIEQIKIYEVPIHQFFGTYYLKEARTWDSTLGDFVYDNNLMHVLNDVRTTVVNFSLLRAERRPVEILFVPNTFTEQNILNHLSIIKPANYWNDPNYIRCYTDAECTKPFVWSTANPLTLYRLRLQPNADYNQIDPYYAAFNFDEFSKILNVYIDGLSKEAKVFNDDTFTFVINDQKISLEQTQKYILKKPDFTISNIVLNDGIIFEVSYSKQIKIYNIENDAVNYPNLNYARNNKKGSPWGYLPSFDRMNEIRRHEVAVPDSNPKRYYYYSFKDIADLKDKYTLYLRELNLGLDDYRRRNGLIE